VGSPLVILKGEKARDSALLTAPVVSIVDDDKTVRLALGSLLRSPGWQACMFGSGEEFLLSGKITNTSCLITDVRMHGMSGVQMHARLLAQGHAPATVFISASDTVFALEDSQKWRAGAASEAI
jgi:FixJ family two-component response regulator